jgi:hypothetical protein
MIISSVPSIGFKIEKRGGTMGNFGLYLIREISLRKKELVL